MQPEDLQSVGGDCNLQFVCDSCINDFGRIPVSSSTITAIQADIKSMKTQLADVSKAQKQIEAKPQTESTANDDAFKLEVKSMLVDIKSALPSKMNPHPNSRSGVQGDGIHEIITRRNQRVNNSRNQLTSNAQQLHTPVIASTSNSSVTTPLSAIRQAPTHASISTTHKPVVISNLHPSTTEPQIIRYVKDKLALSDDQQLFAKALIPKNRPQHELNFISIKVDLPIAIYDKMLATKIWPEHVTVKKFVNRLRKPPVTGVFLS